MLKLMRPSGVLSQYHPLFSLNCRESDRWSAQEVEMFYHGLLKHNKDFVGISRELGSKSTKQCVQFYYLWKWLCPDNYRRLRQRHGRPIKCEVGGDPVDSKDTKDLKDAMNSVGMINLNDGKSILHRTLVICG